MKANVIIYDEVGIEIERFEVTGNIWEKIYAKADFLYDSCPNVTKDWFDIIALS